MSFSTDLKGKGKIISTDENDSSSPIMADDSSDVTAIGKHCDVPSCHQLDFLPFKCGSCEGTFCLDHRTETSHTCPHEGRWAKLRRENSINNSGATTAHVSTAGLRLGSSSTPGPCNLSSCKTMINTPKMIGVTCPSCRQQFCLPHRLSANHECKPITSPAVLSQQQRTKNALDKFKLWATSSSSKVKDLKATPITTKQRSAAARIAEMNKLKKESKGDEKIAMEKRVYLHAQAEAKTTSAKIPEGQYFYSRDWTVGKMMDLTAKYLQIPNVNNQVDDDERRLRVFHIESGRLLSFGEKVGECLADGNTVVLLRGIKVEGLIDL